MKKIAVVGSGSWGVALGMHLARLGNNVKIWSFEKEEADLINNENIEAKEKSKKELAFREKYFPNINQNEILKCEMNNIILEKYEESLTEEE